MSCVNEKLFVYGTLGPGRPNEHILKNIGGSFEAASLTGILHEEGWGADLGFPGLTIDVKGEKIDGFVFSSINFNRSSWADLDSFEGKDYKRVRTKVKLKDGSILEAFVYTIRSQN